jgi:murein DD-endopeptidase MepM/ murein hydrolase activator NlpD
MKTPADPTPTIGYKLSSEEFGPSKLVDLGVRAERAGFPFAVISDHYRPWVDRQGQSPFVWSVLGGLARETETIRIGTGVTCPMMRTHPAAIAQAAATVALVMPGRSFLGVGSGEQLNEHLIGSKWLRARGAPRGRAGAGGIRFPVPTAGHERGSALAGRRGGAVAHDGSAVARSCGSARMPEGGMRLSMTARGIVVLAAAMALVGATGAPRSRAIAPASPEQAEAVTVVVPRGRLGQYRHGTYPSSGNRTHVGVDIVAPCGTPVRAFEDGRVVDRIQSSADPDFSSLGYMLILEHPAAATGRVHYSLYLHLKSPPLPAEEVARGDEVGQVGATGHATGCHLHLEVRYFRDRVSPRWKNIYGPGDQRGARYLLENWEDPVTFIARLERGQPTAERQSGGRAIDGDGSPRQRARPEG